MGTELQMRKELGKNEGVRDNTKDKDQASEDKKMVETMRDRNNNTHKKANIEKTMDMDTHVEEGELQMEEGNAQELQRTYMEQRCIMLKNHGK